MQIKQKLAGGFLFGIGAVALYSILIEPRWLQLRTERIHIRGLHPDLEGLRIGLLSDMHAKPGRTLELVRRACDAIQQEDPALIALTGDFVTEERGSFDDVVSVLKELSAPLGVFAVPGNHDHKAGIVGWREAVNAEPRIQDLTNRSVTLTVGDAALCVAGVDDFEQGYPSLDFLPTIEERDLTLLLSHNPEQAERSRRSEDGIDLILSGHTHAGQIRLPGVGSLYDFVKRREMIFEEGVRRRPWTQVYTTRGLGTVRVPVRLMARPEATILELTGAPRPVW